MLYNFERVIVVSTDQVLKEKIISKVWEDEGFKEELLANPKAAMKKTFQIEFPENLEVNAVSETLHKFYLVIPPKPTEFKATVPKEGAAWQ
jgi:hypothetical protein